LKGIWAVSVIASILILGIGSVYSVYSVGSPTEPEVERTIFIDRYMPTHIGTIIDPGLCDDTSSNFKTISGGIHWKKFPVGYFIDTTNFVDPDGLGNAQAKAAVVRAFDTWDAENHGGKSAVKLFFDEVDRADDADITVEWNNLDGEGGILGVTVTTFQPKAKKIVSAAIVLDSGDRWRNFNLQCGNQGSNASVLEFDIEDIAAHEIGHAIGFAHVNNIFDDVFNTEFVSIIFEGETHKRTLGLGDRIGIFSLYGDGGDDDGGNGGGGNCPPKSNSPKCRN